MSSILFLVMLSCLMPWAVLSEPQVPCYFIFGDSLADPGNNNFLQTQAKANYPPYGVDFPKGPTGRFTNGRTVVDFIAQLLGFPDFIPPFMTATGSQILKGVNYASGAAGIRRESGKTQGDRLSLGEQVFLHKTTVSRLGLLLKGRKAALNYLKKCIYTVGFGSNDYVNNYFMSEAYTTSQEFTTEAYAEVLAQEYLRQLNELYKYGARKVAVLGVGQVGYTPVELSRFGADVATLNAAVELFNAELKTLVAAFNANSTGAMFTFLNSTGISSGSNVTIADLRKSCCSVVTRTNYTCVPFKQEICSNRDEYIFFDNIHPTEAANEPVATRYYSALDPTDA
uniref:GDSL esterase/lipase n=1 Tax=Kalanchoe fedtschenkoi TaxID=63787 RepID=A0A7N0UFR7_KALFE